MIALLVTLAFLPTPSAKHAISAYERDYWHGSAWVSDCRRHGRSKVACVAHVTAVEGNRTTRVLVRDEATMLHGGVIRVHPGRHAIFAVEEALE